MGQNEFLDETERPWLRTQPAPKGSALPERLAEAWRRQADERLAVTGLHPHDSDVEERPWERMRRVLRGRVRSRTVSDVLTVL